MAGEETAAEEQKRKRLTRAYCVSVFLQVLMHISTLMTEPVLLRDLCGGDLAKTTRLLANSQGVVGVLSPLIFQFGGKLSDSLGRRLFLLVGPAANIVNGLIVAAYPRSLAVLLFSRVSRLMFTTFSGTVIGNAALMDVASGTALATAQSTAGATVGIAVILGPIVEEFILKRSNNNFHYPYLLLMVEAVVAFFFSLFFMPETLDRAKRAAIDFKTLLQASNPFGFVRMLTCKSKALKQLTVISTLQTMLEGKNVSDLHQIWARNHLNIGFRGGRLYQTCYGTANVMAGMLLTPFLVTRLSAKNFTTLCNLGLALAFCMRSSERPWLYFSSTVPVMPGVNGASSTALKGLLKGLAVKEGYGMGEFSAWQNNVRAYMGAASVMLYGNLYAWAKRTGRHPGIAWLSASLFGAMLPQILMLLMDKSDLEPVKAEKKSEEK